MPRCCCEPVYGQVPAFAGGERGVMDLLAVDRDGRLAVVELKASADLHLPLQALDYWIRVKWHLDRGEFSSAGYFPGRSLRPEPPRLLLVAPSLEFHPTTETLLGFFSPAIEVERIGLGADWRSRLRSDVPPARRRAAALMAVCSDRQGGRMARETRPMLNALKQVRAAFSSSSPRRPSAAPSGPVHIGLVAADDAGYAEIERFLIPETAGPEHRAAAGRLVHRSNARNVPRTVDFVLYQHGVRRPHGTIAFNPANPRATVSEMLRGNDELALSLARHFPAFRPVVVERTIHGVSLENALFAFATALPDIVPSLIELPWAIGEFASDMAFLTANQIRMAFLIAAACGAPVGFKQPEGRDAHHRRRPPWDGAPWPANWWARSRFGGGLIPRPPSPMPARSPWARRWPTITMAASPTTARSAKPSTWRAWRRAGKWPGTSARIAFEAETHPGSGSL